MEVVALGDMYLTVSNPIEIPDEYKNIGSKLVNVNVNGNDIKIVRTWALSKYREQKVSASSAFIYDKNSSVQQQYNGSGQISISLKKGEKFFFTLLKSSVLLLFLILSGIVIITYPPACMNIFWFTWI